MTEGTAQTQLPAPRASGVAERVERYLDQMADLFLYISMTAMAVMVLLGSADVFGRFLFNRPITGTVEMYEILLPIMALFGIGYAQRVKSHIKVDLLYMRFPAAVRKWLSVFFTLWILGLFVVVSWRGAVGVMVFYQQGRLVSNIMIPIWIVQLLVPVGGFSMCLVLVNDLLRAIWHGEEVR